MAKTDVAALRKRRAEKVDKMDAIASEVQKEERDLTAVEKEAFNQLDLEVKDLDEQIVFAEKVQRLKATTAQPIVVDQPGSSQPSAKAYPQPSEKEEKGMGFARCVRALAANKGIPQLAAQWAAEKWGPAGEGVAKALAAGSAGAGGFIVPDDYSAEIIELKRNSTVIRGSGAAIIPIMGSTQIPRQSAGSAASYVGENNNIGTTQPTFEQIRLTERKLAAIVPISNDLIRNANPQVDTFVRNDLVTSMAITEDSYFIRGVGTSNAPKGIRYWTATANITSTAGTTLANIETDVKFCLNALLGANTAMIRPTWLMAPRTRIFLQYVRDANGVLAFPEVQNGNWQGYPIRETNNIPTNLGGGTESEIYLVDMADAIIGEASGIEIMVSDEAAYHDGSSVQASFSKDQTVVRAIERHDFALRHDDSAAVVTGVTYGA